MNINVLIHPTVPAPTCEAPVSENGVITVTWDYTHTGGLELTAVEVRYRNEDDNEDIDEQSVNVSTTMLDIPELEAGRTYVFEVDASNSMGLTTVECPPVEHVIGK